MNTRSFIHFEQKITEVTKSCPSAESKLQSSSDGLEVFGGSRRLQTRAQSRDSSSLPPLPSVQTPNVWGIAV